MILEVLVALLIFSLGILGLIGLQAAAARQSGQSQYRATATVLANELVGTMWVGNRTAAALQNTYATDSTDAGYLAWQAKVAAALPGAATYPPVITTTVPPVSAATVPAGFTGNLPPTPTPSTQVSITVKWKLPSEPAADAPHNIIIFTQIK